MTRFRYEATDSRGVQWDDILETDSRELAERELESRGLRVLSLRRITEETDEQLSFDLSPQEVAELRSLKRRPTLGLPTGSVRAILTLMLVFYAVVRLLFNQPVRLLWSESLTIAIGHYFATRRLAVLPDSVRRDLERMDLIPREEHPLGLPKNSIRSIIFLAFALVLLSCVVARNPLPDESLGLVLTVIAYIVGHVTRSAWLMISETSDFTAPWWWGDLKALVTIAVVLAALGCSLVEPLIPQFAPNDVIQNIAAAVALFYFGSR